MNKRKNSALVLCLESLEDRVVLTDVTGVINTAVTWSAANSPYVLTGDVFIRQGGIVTVDPGVVIQSPGGHLLAVSDDGSGGTLKINGASDNKVQIVGRLSIDSAASANLDNVNFTPSSTVAIDAAKGAPVTVTNSAFNGAVIVNPEFVPQLPQNNNVFAPNTVVQIIGNRVIDTDTTFPVISNVSRYEIYNSSNGINDDLFVRAGATLTLAAGVTLNSQNPTQDRLFIGDNSTGGKLVILGTQASPDVLQAEAFIQNNATANITYTNISGIFQVNSAGSVALDHVTFSNTSAVTLDAGNGVPLAVSNTAFNGAIFVHPEFVPQLPQNGNSFAPNTIVQIIGNRVIDADTTFPVISNVSRYEIFNSSNGINDDLLVRAGATLTLAAGVTLNSQNPTQDRLFIGDNGTGGNLVILGTQAAPDVLQAEAFIQNNATANITYTNIPGIFQINSTDSVALDHVTFANTSTVTLDAGNGIPLTVTNTAFNGAVIVNPEFVPQLPQNGNTFALNSIVQLIGNRVIDADTTFPVIPHVSRYEIFNSSNGINDDLLVRAGATLTLAPGVILNSQNPAQDRLFIGDNNTGGKLAIPGTALLPVTLQANTFIQNNATADIHYATIPGIFQVNSTASVALDHLTFANTSTATLDAGNGIPLTVSNTAFNGAIIVHPEFVPKLPLNGNTFTPNSIIQLLGARVVDSDTTFPAIPNVSRYEIFNSSNGINDDISVRSGATLTLAPGITFNSQNAAQDRLLVGDNGTGGKLTAANVTFNAEVLVGSGGSIHFRYVAMNQLLQLNSGANIDVHLSDFSSGAASVESIGNPAVSIDLTNNFWKFTTDAEIEANKLVDDSDNPLNSRPKIIFDPFLTATPLDTTPPVLGANFEYQSRQAIHLVFSEDVRPTLSTDDFVLRNRTTQQTISLPPVVWDDPFNTSATILFDKTSPLPDGDYRLTLVGSISDPSGNVVAPFTFDFFVLSGDANHDRSVGFADLVAVAQNYGATTSVAFSQGDFDYNGKVDFQDLVSIAQNYGKTLAIPALPASTAMSVGSIPPIAAPPAVTPPNKTLFSITPIIKPAAVKPKPIVPPKHR